MAEDKISELFDLDELKKQTGTAISYIDQFINHIKNVKDINIKIANASSVSDFNKLNKELKDNIKLTEQSSKSIVDESRAREANAKAALAEAKAFKEESKAVETLSKAKVNDAKAADISSKSSERRAAAEEKAAQKADEAKRPYKQLALAFAAAAKEAQDLGVKYGTTDKRAQAAAKRANELNNELKKIDATIGNHQRNVGNYASALDGVGGKLKSLATNFLSLIGIVGVGSIFSSAIDEFIEMDKNVRLLQNTLRNIGVPEAFDRIKNSADDLAKQFTYLDNDDILKSFNQLIVYGKLTEDQINQLVPVIIDFAAATGQDLGAATSTVIKSLEGNGKALKEFGINMKDAKSTTEAFSLIMTQLKPRVDGVGKSFGDSAAGGIASAKQEFKDLKEELGEGLLPVLNSILSVLNKIVQGAAGGVKAIRSFFSGEGFVGSIVESSLGGDEKAQAAIEQDFQANLSVLKDNQKQLEELQKQGKKLNVTQDDITREFLNNLQKLNDDRKKRIAEVKKSGNVQDIKEILVQYAATQKTVDELQRRLEGGKVLGLGKPTNFGAPADDKAEKERLKRIEDAAKAEFEIFKLEQERIADFAKKIAEDENANYLDRLIALNDYAEARKKIIEATAKFELRNKKLTDKEVELVDAKRVDQTIRLAKELTDILKINVDDFKKGATGVGIAVNGMQKSMVDAIEAVKRKNEELREEVIKKNKEAIKSALKDLLSEVQGLIFDLFTNDIEKQKNAVQERIDLLDEQKQKEIEVENQRIQSAQDRAANIAIIEARAAAEKEQLQKRQRQLDEQKAKFDKAQAIAGIIVNTARGITAALASIPPNPILAGIVAAIGAVQLVRALATPIPKYARGGTHKDGGLAIVGDGGKSEGIQLPDGSFLKTPAKSTLVDIPAGSKIHPDYDKMMLNASLTKPPMYNVKTSTEATEKAVLKVGKQIVGAIKNQPQTVIKGVPEYKRWMKKGSTWTEYLDRSL